MCYSCILVFKHLWIPLDIGECGTIFFSRAATAVAVEKKEWLEDKVLCFPPPSLLPVGTIKEAFFSPSSLRPRETSIDSLEYSEEEIH